MFSPSALLAHCARPRDLAERYLETGAVVNHIKHRRAIGIHERGEVPQHTCEIWIEQIADSDNHVTLQLVNVPIDEDLELFINDQEGEVTHSAGRVAAKLRIGTIDSTHINELAKSILGLIGRGRHYSNKNWRWVCPKTTATLTELARTVRTSRV